MLRFIYPRKCVFCEKILGKDETDFCHSCRNSGEMFKNSKRNIPFVAHWTALWYYKDNVRLSIHRYKFGRRRTHSQVYGRLMAMSLYDSLAKDVDLLCWVPVHWLRKHKRGYDQSELIARIIGKELSLPVVRGLKKIRNNAEQSGIEGIAQRKANVSGVYRVCNTSKILGKRILLIDDVVTTGSTASECAKMLLIAGAKEVYLAAVAASSQK